MNFKINQIMFIIVLITKMYTCKDEKQCFTSCNNFIKFKITNSSRNAVEKMSLKVHSAEMPPEIKVSYMKREKYWNVVEKNFGDKPVSYGIKKLLPSLIEAKEWYSKSMCKIGEICPLNGDCWGSWASKCYSDETKNWVNSKTLNLKGMQWSTAFHQTCTLDWSCDITTANEPSHFKSDGSFFIVNGNKRIMLTPGQENFYRIINDYVIFIEKVPVETKKTLMLDCFKHLKELLCEVDDGSYVVFEEGTQCTVLGNIKYCLIDGEFNRLRDFGANKFASVSDLNQIRDAFIVAQEKENYNNFILQTYVTNLEKTILDIVAELSKTSPNILNKVLNGNYFVRNLENYIFEVCSCKNDAVDCKIKEFHHPKTIFCSDSVKYKEVTLIKTDKEIDFSIDEKFRFQGKNVDPVLSYIEKAEQDEDFESTKNAPKSSWENFTENFNPFSWLSNYVGYIALLLSLFNLMKK